MKLLETLPTRSEWFSRLTHFFLNQDECLQSYRHLRIELLDAYHMVKETISMSIFIPCGGFRVYQMSLDFDSLANALAFEFSLSIFITFILNIDFDCYSVTKVEVDNKYTLVLSLKTTLEVCA